MKVNLKNIGLYVLFIIAITVIYLYNKEILEMVKTVLLYKPFNIILALIVFATTLFYKIRYNQIKLKDLSDVKKFKSGMSDLISLLTEPATFICSFAILKGLFLDYYFSFSYFKSFEMHEKGFLLTASFFFFISSVIELKDYFVELFFNKAEEVSGVK